VDILWGILPSLSKYRHKIDVHLLLRQTLPITRVGWMHNEVTLITSGIQSVLMWIEISAHFYRSGLEYRCPFRWAEVC